ncbi:hypothetical protein FA13DRAFT_1796143 [Coprinellus micaceus]|uniref:Uncharacterized protein n=1 Tax=Coprinellus micaceus TaxID=71717 RepID=A0A4Y7SVD7_COPMI|nr:hypothetical protein FA13DRAFT_1796143 [Coprinellus micaceus]
MQLKNSILSTVGMLALALSGTSATKAVKEGDVFTATRVVHTLLEQSPYIVDRTTTVVWTAGRAMPTTDTPTPIPHTIGPGPRTRSVV